MSLVIDINFHCMLYRPFLVQQSIHISHIHQSLQLFQLKILLPCKLRTHYQSCCPTIQQYLYCNSLLSIYPLQPNLYCHFPHHNVFNEDLLSKCREPYFKEQHMDLVLQPTIIDEKEKYKVEEVRKYRK